MTRVEWEESKKWVWSQRVCVRDDDDDDEDHSTDHTQDDHFSSAKVTYAFVSPTDSPMIRAIMASSTNTTPSIISFFFRALL